MSSSGKVGYRLGVSTAAPVKMTEVNFLWNVVAAVGKMVFLPHQMVTKLFPQFLTNNIGLGPHIFPSGIAVIKLLLQSHCRLDDRVSIPGSGMDFSFRCLVQSSSGSTPDILTNGYRGLFPRGKAAGFIYPVHLEPRPRMRGSLPLIHYMSSWHVA